MEASPPVFNPLDHRIAMELIPLRLHLGSAWITHVPFAFALVEMCRPTGMIVELGAHHGVSYCAFCQAVAALKLPTRCAAIDTWAGDPHAGVYGPDVLENLRLAHDPLYASFSTLMQSTFDDALERITDASVDILHIDGLHTYEAVRHDFETWKLKMSPRGVVLFHDTQERMGDFGVWKLWAELAPTRPSFEFEHGHGLGVLGVGEDLPPKLAAFLAAAAQDRAGVELFFSTLGKATSRLLNVRAFAQRTAALINEIQRGQANAGESVQEADAKMVLANLQGAFDYLNANITSMVPQLKSISSAGTAKAAPSPRKP